MHLEERIMEEFPFEEALIRAYDRLNPHHSDAVDKTHGYRELLQLMRLNREQIRLISDGLRKVKTEIDDRNGAFSSRVSLNIQQTIDMLEKKKPC